MKYLKWTVNKEQSDYMKHRQQENIERSLRNPNENWMAERLKETGMKWTRQARWGYRLFDFWNKDKGIAVEVDGPEHRKDVDAFHDDENYKISGILVIRVRNRNEADADKAIKTIKSAGTWHDRRVLLGIRVDGKRRKNEQSKNQMRLLE